MESYIRRYRNNIIVNLNYLINLSKNASSNENLKYEKELKYGSMFLLVIIIPMVYSILFNNIKPEFFIYCMATFIFTLFMVLKIINIAIKIQNKMQYNEIFLKGLIKSLELSKEMIQNYN
jgi:hypothetical protein